ncbi:phosphatase PAP2 family protein [Mycobacterium sp.]|uniref:phosphatase PAP2 family protein n=1 Tax=Mycobacterium sp. TaxID=1785 RepID=UPI002BD85EE2|nr:phosphatase PAP2 family protein [Mycobacterium sp.]HKP43356.1 phosphatase PAP2 family protein [Mycobacterium sp.]
MTSHRTWLICSAVVAVAVYALMWIGYALQWNWLTTIDSSTLDVFYRYGIAHPSWVTAWNVFCTVLGPTVFRLLALVVIIVALVRRNRRVALFLVISVELSGLVTEIAKQAANRPRPATAFVTAPSSSLPSGHALGVMVGVLALLTVVLTVVRRPFRAWLIGFGAVVVVLVGIGRVVLNVHHPSDVLAGWVLGYAYFVACLLTVPPSRPVTVADETPAAPDIAR